MNTWYLVVSWVVCFMFGKGDSRAGLSQCQTEAKRAINISQLNNSPSLSFDRASTSESIHQVHFSCCERRFKAKYSIGKKITRPSPTHLASASLTPAGLVFISEMTVLNTLISDGRAKTSSHETTVYPFRFSRLIHGPILRLLLLKLSSERYDIIRL